VVVAAPATAQCELAELVASDGLAMDDFGNSIAVSGDRVLIGAPNDDEGGTDRGSAYLFELQGGSFVEIAKLLPSDPNDSDRFGWSVAIDGDVAVVGALSDDGAAFEGGAAYVFEPQGGVWVQTKKLLAGDPFLGDLFGIAVAVDGDRIAVGACQFTTFQVLGFGGGRSYVFERQGADWVQMQRIAPADVASGDRFGAAIDIDGDRILVTSEDDDDSGSGSGSAYVYELVGGTWTQGPKLHASDGAAGDLFGAMATLDGDLAVVGAPGDDLGGLGNAGSAYVFERVGGVWSEVAKLTASDASAQARLGRAVGLDGETVILGSHADTPTTQGAVYVFERRDGAWLEVSRLVASDSIAGDELGHAVAVKDGWIATGARLAGTTGSAYVFQNTSAATLAYGCGVNPAASLTILSGAPRLGTTVQFGVDNPLGTQTPGGSLPLLLFANAPDAAFPCGTSFPGFGMDGGAGEILISLFPPNPLLPVLIGSLWAGPGMPAPITVPIPNSCTAVGQSFYFQGVLFDPSGPPAPRIGLTEAIRLRIGP
jgi:hypothetical protein